ncbi:hypothetical protein GPECTOR_31g339 [Gonium pectorale]|uniref:Inositol-pentakisphosphate 2-kinase n=1 Tax=Gonium pectorale TaxID=33097 RepID=A0A150GDR1_GONPE|nr:hypothetical protein GPECTOR_31g339 [Gonium pectorale]|eukprot:KXZ47977.1 hypothetical protein GPECTOR_31g339 [Gonium pectorale]
MEWQLKGRGAANAVFGYCGNDHALVGHVLRVRMASRRAPEAADQTIWAGVLDAADGDDTCREMLYMSDVIAPLLGSQYVFTGVPFPVPSTLYEALDGLPDGHGGDHLATIQPDHTTFLANAPPDGYVGVGPTVCMEIKPKWGLRPDEAPAGTGAGAAVAAPSGRQAGTVSGAESTNEAAAAAAPGITTQGSNVGRRYPRFMLHMLLKHVQKGYPLSLYNPLDLFSGELGAMQRAIRSLLECPSGGAQAEAGRAPGTCPAGRGAEGEAQVVEVEAEAVSALVRLAALALQREDVLSNVHKIQALDELGPQGALQLYGELVEAMQSGASPASDPGWAARLSALRAYLTSATAKDCALMVTMQRALPATAAATGSAVAGFSDTSASPLPPAPAAAPAAANAPPRTQQAVQLLLDSCSAASPHRSPATAASGAAVLEGVVPYLVKVAVVDLDVKPAAKIRSHAALEAKLLACAEQHAGLLAEYAARAGWRAPQGAAAPP